jgi:hypothetical protein
MNNSEGFMIAVRMRNFGKRFFILFTAIQMICSVMNISSLVGQSKNAFLSQQKVAILTIPVDMLYCGFCLDTLDAVIDSLNHYSHRAIIWGIVTDSNNQQAFSDSMIAVRTKQIHGFIIGRSIKFPVIFDINNILAKSSNPALIILSTGESLSRIDLSINKNLKFATLLKPE